MPLSTAVRENTLVDTPRLLIIQDFLDKTSILEGDVAEVGVYKGGTALLICKNTIKKVFLFDTFEGMPDVKSVDLHRKGDFCDTSIRDIDFLLYPYKNYSVYKGVFPRQNTEYITHRKFSFVHLDVDIYDSVRECLEFFSTRMLPGGVIILDDYNEVNCPGAKLATDEFCQKTGMKLIPTTQSQAFIQF